MNVNEIGFLKKIIEATIKMNYGVCKINSCKIFSTLSLRLGRK